MVAAESAGTTTWVAYPPSPVETTTRAPTTRPLTSSPTAVTRPATSLPGVKGRGGLIWYCPAMNRPSTKFTPAASTSTTTCPGPGIRSGRSSTLRRFGGPSSLQTTTRTAGHATAGPPDRPTAHHDVRRRATPEAPHGQSYLQEVTDVRPARPEELALLPILEEASDTLFLSLGIGPLPPPGTAADLAAAPMVLVVGDPPAGFARLELLGGGAHLEQLSVQPDHMRRGHGRPVGPRRRLRPDHPGHLPGRAVERALLRVGGLRRTGFGRRVARRPRPGARGPGHGAVRHPGAHEPCAVSSG